MKDQKGGDEHSSNPKPPPPTPPSPVLGFWFDSQKRHFSLVHVGQWFPFTCFCSQTSPLKRAAAVGVCGGRVCVMCINQHLVTLGCGSFVSPEGTS